MRVESFVSQTNDIRSQNSFKDHLLFTKGLHFLLFYAWNDHYVAHVGEISVAFQDSTRLHYFSSHAVVLNENWLKFW